MNNTLVHLTIAGAVLYDKMAFYDNNMENMAGWGQGLHRGLYG